MTDIQINRRKGDQFVNNLYIYMFYTNCFIKESTLQSALLILTRTERAKRPPSAVVTAHSWDGAAQANNGEGVVKARVSGV